MKCKNCYQFGHGEKRCPEPAGGADTYGGGSGGGWDAPADSAAAVGGWDTGADSATVATGGWGGEDAGTVVTDNWADQANSEAQW